MMIRVNSEKNAIVFTNRSALSLFHLNTSTGISSAASEQHEQQIQEGKGIMHRIGQTAHIIGELHHIPDRTPDRTKNHQHKFITRTSSITHQ